MGNTNNMISAEELEQLSKQSGLTQDILQKQFNNFKKFDRQNKGTLDSTLYYQTYKTISYSLLKPQLILNIHLFKFNFY